MWDFSIRQSLGLMGRTLPFILLRMAVYFGITLGYILSTGAGVGLGWGIGAFGDEGFRANATMWGGFAGFGLFGAFLIGRANTSSIWSRPATSPCWSR